MCSVIIDYFNRYDFVHTYTIEAFLSIIKKILEMAKFKSIKERESMKNQEKSDSVEIDL